MHGRTSIIEHQQTDLFAGLPQQFTVCRYHSLVVDPASLPEQLRTTATCPDGTIMALRHRRQAVFGLQFHPEAILTEYGFELLQNFLKIAGLSSSSNAASLAAAEHRPPSLQHSPLPQQPVTF